MTIFVCLLVVGTCLFAWDQVFRHKRSCQCVECTTWRSMEFLIRADPKGIRSRPGPPQEWLELVDGDSDD